MNTGNVAVDLTAVTDDGGSQIPGDVAFLPAGWTPTTTASTTAT